jgi:hypothetical protein
MAPAALKLAESKPARTPRTGCARRGDRGVAEPSGGDQLNSSRLDDLLRSGLHLRLSGYVLRFMNRIVASKPRFAPTKRLEANRVPAPTARRCRSATSLPMWVGCVTGWIYRASTGRSGGRKNASLPLGSGAKEKSPAARSNFPNRALCDAVTPANGGRRPARPANGVPIRRRQPGPRDATRVERIEQNMNDVRTRPSHFRG